GGTICCVCHPPSDLALVAQWGVEHEREEAVPSPPVPSVTPAPVPAVPPVVDDDGVLVIHATPEVSAPEPVEENTVYSHFLHWVSEREVIRVKREAGEPGPWTDDPILRQFRFCNVARKRDRVSRWILAHLIEPYREAPYLLEFLALGRWVNWP